jgi:predicted ABC-type transport system involved in lysophospholipase L1 biosynthesis ATPase subunit
VGYDLADAARAEVATPARSVAGHGAGGPLLRVEGLTKSYAGDGIDTTVLNGVDLEIRRGETISLMGASGSGKSTLISLLAGLIEPDSGRVTFDGVDLTGLDDTQRAILRANRIGIVMQTGNLIPFLSAAENVSLAVELAGGSRPDARARELLLQVGLAGRLDHYPRRLSGGESQRVAVAMALVNEPDLLLADEATGALDSGNAEQVLTLIMQARAERGLSVLLVTHSGELAATCDRRLRLVAGKVIAA